MSECLAISSPPLPAPRAETNKIESPQHHLRITSNLVADLELATLDIATDLGGRKFARILLTQSGETLLWSPQTLDRIHHYELAQSPDKELGLPLLTRIVGRAAEIQHGRKPAKSIERKALTEINIAATSTAVEQSQAEDISYEGTLQGLIEWPKSHTAFQRVLASQAEQAELDNYAMAAHKPFIKLGEAREVRKLAYLLSQAKFNRAQETYIPMRRQAVADIYGELSDFAIENGDSGSLEITDITEAPVAALLSMIAAVRTSIHINDLITPTQKIAESIHELVNSDNGLVFFKRHGIGKISDFRLHLRDTERTSDDLPAVHLTADSLVAANANHPRDLQARSNTVWEISYLKEDIVSLASRVADNGVRPLDRLGAS